MNPVLSRVTGNIFLSVNRIQSVPVRFRYYAEKIARGPYSKKFGYVDKIFNGGPLGRLNDDVKIRQPVYRPANAWSPEKVALGQNDYIDILGGGKINPPQVKYDVPKWLRGRKGNEMELLILKQKVYKNTLYEVENPTRMENMVKRMKRLYFYLNHKTKTSLSRQ